MLWHSLSLHFFPFSLECILALMKWIDQMTVIWSFESIHYQIQIPILGKWFHRFVYTTSLVLWLSKSIFFFPSTIGSFLPRMKWVDQLNLNWSFEWFSYQIQNASFSQWFNGYDYTTSRVLWYSRLLYFFPSSFECCLAQMQ